jgi:hypothetical protein
MKSTHAFAEAEDAVHQHDGPEQIRIVPSGACRISPLLFSYSMSIGPIEIDRLGLIWMRIYSSQFTCVEMDWSRIKLNSISFYSNTCGLK